jgi:hypothetical protein
MILGLSTFAWLHTLLSLVALVAGIVVLIGLIGARRRDGWTALFLVTAVATNVTAFGFPTAMFEASHWVGVLSLVVLAVTILARYVFHLVGAWRWIFAVGAVVALYFDVFVGIAQAFKKVPALKAMAPTLSEPPFAYAELATLAVFVVLAIAAAIKFRAATEARH